MAGTASIAWKNQSSTRPTVVLLTAPNGTFTKPAGVTQVLVECWGGGGAGGGSPAGTVGGGAGGAGGQYARKLITYPSAAQNIPYSVSRGSVGGLSDGPAGTDTTWNTNVVVAKGGAGGQVAQNNPGVSSGAIGSTTGGIGDVVYAGGSGGNGYFQSFTGFFISGSGGGGGGSTGAGGDGFGSGPGGGGLGTADYGGNGGDGYYDFPQDVNGNPGNNFGGAGGGAVSNSLNRSGGSGGAGLIRVTYTPGV